MAQCPKQEQKSLIKTLQLVKSQDIIYRDERSVCVKERRSMGLLLVRFFAVRVGEDYLWGNF